MFAEQENSATVLAGYTPLVDAAGRSLLHALLPVAWLLASLATYKAIIAAVPKQGLVAHAHAALLIALEQRLHIFLEPQLRQWALHHAALPVLGVLDGRAVEQFVIQVYDVAQLPWLVAALFWLYIFQRQHFGHVARLAVLGTMVSIMIAALYPVAPPRFTIFVYPPDGINLLTVPEAERSLTRYLGWNPYAAFPSLHVYWSLVTGYALVLGAPNRMCRGLVAVFPLVVIFSVIVTANHYVVDCIASLGLFFLCNGVLTRLERAMQPMIPAATGVRSSARAGKPTIRDLDAPLMFAGTLGMLQLVSTDHVQQAIGAVLFLASGASIIVARRRAACGVALQPSSPLADWWAGLLLVAGTTTIGTVLGANAGDRRAAAALLWLLAAGLPLLGRLNLRWHAIRPGIHPLAARTAGLQAGTLKQHG